MELDGRNSAGVEYVGGTFAASEDVFDHAAVYGRVVVLGPGDLALVPAEGVIRAPLVDGVNPSASDISVELPHGVPDFTGWENYQSARPTPNGWEVTLRQYGDDVDTFFVVDVSVDGDSTLSDRASGSPVARGAAIVVERSIRNDLSTSAGGRSPQPLFERTGQRVDSPLPTLPPDSSAASPSTTSSNDVAVPHATTVEDLDEASGNAVGNDDGGNTVARLFAGGILMLVVIAGSVLVARQSADWRRRFRPRGRGS